MIRPVLLALGIFLSASTALALDAIPGEDRFRSMMGEDSSTAGSDLGFVKIGDTWYMNLSPRFDLRMGKFGLGLQVPLNVPLPGQDDVGDGFLREEDWDETSDYFRMVRYVQYGDKRDTVFVRFGELTGSIGHGTIVGAYTNNIDIDSFRPGLQFDLNTDFGGFETLVSDVVTYTKESQESKLMAVRAYVKPLALFMPDSPLNIFSVGVSYAADGNAPTAVSSEAESTTFTVDSDAALKVYGMDFDAEVLNNDLITLVPYVDFNKIDGAGTGLHLGVQTVFKFPVGLNLQIPVTFEYRNFSSNYVAQYFNTIYELERFSMLSVAPGTPKAAYITGDALKDGPGLNGFYGDFAFDFLGIAQVGGIYEHYKAVAGSDSTGDASADGAEDTSTSEAEGLGTLSIYLSVPALEVVDFKAYYNRTGITGADDMFKFDERSMAVAQARYKLYPMVYVVGQAQRLWEYDAAQGQYAGVDSYGMGVEFVFDF